jgi:hypothetical protein
MNAQTIDLNDPYMACLMRRAEDAAERDACSCVVRPAMVGWRVTTAESEQFWARHAQQSAAMGSAAGASTSARD